MTLVGKGVTFDTGGLDIKPASAMALMKKDMAGAATALGARRHGDGCGPGGAAAVLLPVVENAISASAFRPGDIYRSRKGLTVEIGNTDAEGRLVLADALALACEESPGSLVDFATLTGAARVALGPDLPAFYTDDEALAAASRRATPRRSTTPSGACRSGGPTTRCSTARSPTSTTSPAAPSRARSRRRCSSTASSTPGVRTSHFDLYGWNPSAKPGRPEGGEAPTARLRLRAARGAGRRIAPAAPGPSRSPGASGGQPVDQRRQVRDAVEHVVGERREFVAPRRAAQHRHRDRPGGPGRDEVEGAVAHHGRRGPARPRAGAAKASTMPGSGLPPWPVS